MPEMTVGIYDRALFVDHQRERAWFVHHGFGWHCTALSKAVDVIVVPRPLTPAPLASNFVLTSAVCPEMSFAAHAASFTQFKRYLRGLVAHLSQVIAAIKSGAVGATAGDSCRRVPESPVCLSKSKN